MIFVSESKINGETSLIKKLPGDTIKQGSLVIHGNAHLEVMNLDKQICRPNKVQHTEIVKNIKLFQFI